MSFSPNILERIARARADLRMGVPVIITGEGKALLAASAETLTEERLSDFRAVTQELVLVVTARRANTLKAQQHLMEGILDSNQK